MSNNVKTIILLHGWGVSSEVLQPLAELLRKEGHTVLTPDFPGFGDQPEPDRAWSVDNYAEWLAWYCDRKKLKSIVLFAHSFGGRVAIKFAVKYPERVERLILCGAAGIRPKFTLKSAILLIASKIGKFAPEQIQQAAEKQFGHLDVFQVSGVMRETLKNVVRENLRPYLKHLHLPTLLIWGEDDLLTPLRDAYIMEKEIPRATLATLRNEGHTVYRTNPHRVFHEIEKFLKP